ncbi:MAG TPA: HAMP domain-containing sensor histidine kinase [Polyangiales bacterium]
MPKNDHEPSPERKQTDASLRVERDLTDQALADRQVSVDQTADAVIARARARADEVLSAARTKTDRRSTTSAQSAPFPQTMERERALEDRILREERASADHTLRAERLAHVALLASEREETNQDLFSERARSDQALATRDEFLSIVSHDLGNMLNTIVLYAGLIAERLSLDADAVELVKYAQRIQGSGVRMSRLIGDLVDVASIDAGTLAVTRELLDAARVVREAVDTFQAPALASGISVLAEIIQPLPPVVLDPARILQVLVNLLSNAIKFTPTGGKVTVHVARIADELRFAVSDTGSGIPTDQLDAIFERFRQLNKNDRRGLGLGLYISKCIVQGHGGRIWAESAKGAGSTVYFTLPLAPPPRELGA